MATLLTHAFVGATLAGCKRNSSRAKRWWVAAAFCSMIPDIDVMGFGLGIHYGDLWGHRGMTHSLLFAAAVSIAAALLVAERGKTIMAATWLFAITASHGVLDAMTNGGLGVAFFSPFDRHRYFFPWRPIAVSPIGTHGLFSSRMAHILVTEFLWVWIPTAAVWVIVRGMQRGRPRTASNWQPSS
jgi:inner membrane protein